MKKSLILLFAASLGVVSMSSCKKTSKGKMTGEWTLASMTSESTDTDTPTSGTSSTSTSTTTIDGTTITDVYTSGGNTTTTTGTVNTATFSINKDGSWTRKLDFTFTGTGYTQNSVAETSGTWSFVKKNKSADLGTNERVLFTTLEEKNTTTTTISGTSSTSNDNYTYAEGEETEVFVVTESKKKSLTMTSEENYSNTDDNGTYTSVGTTTINLTQE